MKNSSIFLHTRSLRLKALTVWMIIGSLTLSAQENQRFASNNNPYNSNEGWTVNDPFKAEVFIENKGQFNKPDGQSQENILYGINNGELKVYFSPSGLSYHMINVQISDKYKNDKEEILEKMKRILEKRGNTDEIIKKYFNDKSAFVNIQWEGANPNAQIVVSEKIYDTYSYPTKDEYGNPIVASAFKKLTYKNIYPNIDVEYYFTDKYSDNTKTKLGVKYNIVVHPGGDISRVKMKYSGMQNISLDQIGNVIMEIPDGSITDHAPDFSYVDTESKQVQAKFILQGQTVSFNVPQYDKTKQLVIDPYTSVWSVSPGFTTTNNGYTIRIDYNQNAYVMGGVSPNYQVKKFNPAGVLQWTAAASSSFIGAYGDMLVLRAGKVIVGTGIGNGAQAFIIATSNGAVTTKNCPGGVNEFGWRLYYNLKVNDGVMWAGGGSNNGSHLIKTDTSLNAANIYNVWNSNTGNRNTEDIAYLAQDPASSFVYITNASNTSNNGVSGSTSAPKFCKSAVGTPGTAIWQVNEPTLMMELGQGSFIAAATPATGVNGMVVCGNRIYTYDGNNIRAYNDATGAIVNSATSGGAIDKYSGLDVDNCCRVYVGVKGIVKRYSSSLVFDASFTVTGDVYDLKFDPQDDNYIFVTGKGFVQKLKKNVCPTCISATKTDVSGCTLGTGTVSITDPSGTAPYTYSWNTSPIQTTKTISGLSPGTYIVTVTDGASPCPLTWKDTIVVGGTFVSCGPTVTAVGGAVCPGACVNITATGASTPGPFTYAWQPGALTGSSVNVCPLSTKTYTVVATNGAGATASTTAVVTVNPAPTPTITGNTTICVGNSTSLTANGGGAYSWSTSPVQTTPAITVSPTINPTTYSVTVTTGGCTGSASVSVIVNPLPVPTISGMTTICAGQSTTLTATGGGTYNWSTAPVQTTPSITVSPVSGTTTYTVTVTNGGCTGTATVAVTVASNLIPVITGNTTICNGAGTTLTTSGGGTYAWSDGTTNPSITVNPTINPTTYSVTVTNGTCSGTATVQVTVNPNPIPTITGATSICPGTSTTLTANGGTTYVWSTGVNTPSIVVPTAGTYSVTATSLGCTGQTSVVVTITPPPVPTITGNTVICIGGSTTLTATGGGTYSWSTSPVQTTPSITVSPGGTTIYTVIVTTGCSASASVQVTVQPTITPVITGTLNICDGASTTLTTSGGGTYAWSTTETTPSITVTPIVGSSTYSVTVTNGLCSGTASVVVTVNPKPAPVITGNMTLCSGQNTMLTATGGGTYNWSSGGQATAAITVSPTVNPTNYIVTVTANGCTGSASAQVTVNPAPIPSITGPTAICTGQSATLTSSTSGPYNWSNGATNNTITITPGGTTTYSVSITVNGCTGTANHTVKVTPPVIASITGNNICVGQNTTLKAGGGSTYLWNTGETTSTITKSPTVGTYTYTVIVAVGSCADTATYTIKVNPLPTPIASGDTTILYGQSTYIKSSGGGTYQWVPPGGLSCTNCPNPIATPIATTQYCVIVKDTAGCTDRACVTIRVDLKCGFEGELFVPNGFSPNGDGQNDILYVRGLGITSIYWVIYDRWGEKVFETTDPKQGWDGTYKGKALDPAVFVYYYKATCITGDEVKRKGNVAIIK